MNFDFDTLTERETEGINHTYSLDVTLSNLSPKQQFVFNLLLDSFEKNGVVIKNWNIEND